MSELPTGWEQKYLGDVIKLKYGKSLPEKERHPGNFVVYGSNGSIGSHDVSLTNAPALIVGRKGSIGEVHLSETPCWPIDTTYFVDEFGSHSPTFWFWYLKHLKLDQLDRATAIPGLSREDAYKLQVLVPPPDEQRRIVARLDALLARTRRAREELARVPTLAERAKQAVLAKAFSGELTEEWRREQNLPEPYNVDLGSVANDFSYGSAAKSQESGKVPVLRMGNIQNCHLDWEDLVFTSDEKEIAKYQLEPGNVLFNRTNSPALVGKTAIYKGDQKAIYAGYLIRIRCGPELLPDFLNYCLNSPMGRDYCWRVKTDGVSQSNINSKKLAAFSFDLPALAEQAEIVARIEAAFARIDRAAAEAGRALALLERTEQAALAKAFRGELG